MNKEIISEFEATLNEFLTILSSFSQQEFNTHPSPNSWTAGQVAEHIRKSLNGGVVLLTTDTKPANRPPHQLVEIIQKVFTDFSQRLNSPDFIIPADIIYNKVILLQELSAAKEIGTIAKPLDLSELCMAFPFPVFGHLTRLEIIHFFTYHIKRHIWQLKNIADKLSVNVTIEQ